MFHLTITSIMNRITSIAASYAKTIGYAALALAVTSSMTACNGKIYADLFNNNNSTLLMLLGGKAPTVTFTSTPIINNANKINYTITGTCSEDGQPVVLVVGSGAPPLSVTNSPVCTGGDLFRLLDRRKHRGGRCGSSDNGYPNELRRQIKTGIDNGTERHDQSNRVIHVNTGNKPDQRIVLFHIRRLLR